MFDRLPRLKLSIRAKALLLSPLLLSIPYVGYQYVREMEDFLRVGLEGSVLATARALASALNDQAALFARADAAAKDDVVYAHPLPAAIEVDGYSGDWQGYEAQMRPLPVRPASSGGSGHYVAGKRGDYLYLLVRIDDDDIVYRSAQAGAASDHLLLSLRDRRGAEKHYLLGTRSPGWVNVREIDAGEPGASVRIEVRIRAAWQVFEGGYAVEIRLPLGMLGDGLGLGAIDIDGAGEPLAQRWRPALRTLILPSSAIEDLIRRLGRLQGTRVWVLDHRRRVLARGGTLAREIPSKPINPLYALLLRPPSAEVFREHPVVSRLQGPEIDAALAGNTRTRWRAATANDNSWIVSAAYPVWSDEAIVGVVVVEETSLGIQTLTREALANLFNKTLLVTVAGALALALFASGIARRLGRLRDEADAAIDTHGRVVGTLPGTHGSDEIGDLSATFSAMMERLRQYNDYLQNLARRLSHELRTPIAIVRSSLESMQIDPSPEATRLYGARAHEGLTRLNAILTRMSEASRLEEALQSAEREVFELDAVLRGTVAAYCAAWPQRSFHYAPSAAGPMLVDGVPDLVVQMLDKLVSNALELGVADKPIQIALSGASGRLTLTVTNYGSQLPGPMQATLFESMVSIRQRRDRGAPHLGLGLYIARIIAEFHGARIGARNLADGVEMKIEFPRRPGAAPAPT